MNIISTDQEKYYYLNMCICADMPVFAGPVTYIGVVKSNVLKHFSMLAIYYVYLCHKSRHHLLFVLL